MIEGCLLWQQHGLSRPESIIQSVDDYLQAEDTLGAWIEDRLNVGPTVRTSSSDAYNDFRKWAEENGEYCPSQKRFTGWLVKRGFQSVKINIR